MASSAAWFYEGQLRLHRNWNWPTCRRQLKAIIFQWCRDPLMVGACTMAHLAPSLIRREISPPTWTSSLVISSVVLLCWLQESNQMHAVCLDTFPPISYLTDTSHAIIRLVHAVNGHFGENRVSFGLYFHYSVISWNVDGSCFILQR